MTKAVQQTSRFIYIAWILLRYGLDSELLSHPLFASFRFIAVLNPWYWISRKHHLPRGQRIRLALEELGPIFVKFGQILSTRRDLLPIDIAEELALLQDQVPPFDNKEAVKIIESQLGANVKALFETFQDQPLASASIAQVHAATLKSGEQVVVKVVRPGIRKTIRRDIGLLYFIAELAQRYWREGKRLRPIEVVAEFEKHLLDELDLEREAANATQLRRNFENSPLLYVPEVYWDLTRRDVMVMERIHGIPIGDVAQLHAAGVDMKVLSERGVQIFFTQVFKHSFFHADMHPGNIFVDATNPADPKYVAIDFGIMGTLAPVDQHYLASNFLAFFNRDYRTVAELHIESEWVPADTRVDEFESAIRTVCEPIFMKPLKEISFGHVLLRLFQTARRFDMQVQPQLVMLQKTLLNVEGLGRSLYPDLDLWDTAKPFFETWMSDQIGPKRMLKEVKRQWPKWAEMLPTLPTHVAAMVQDVQQTRRLLQRQNDELRQLRQSMRINQIRTFLGIIAAAFIVSAFIISGLDGFTPKMLWGVPVATWILGVLGGYLVFISWPFGSDD